MTRTLIALAAAAVALTVAPAAHARQANSTTGSCEIEGRAYFGGIGIGNVPSLNTYSFAGAGTCDGTLNGEPIADSPIEVEVRGSGLLSCLVSVTGENDRGTMRFTRGTHRRTDDAVIRFEIDPLVGAGPQNEFRARGAVSGEALGRSEFLSEEDTLDRCAAGTLEEISFRSSVHTLTPIVG
jgi:hypothetical protein